MSSTELVQHRFDLASLSMEEMNGIAAVFYKAGTFKSVQSQAEALVKIIAGQELGVKPLQAMNGIHMVDGEPRLSAGLVGALVKRSGRYDYRVEQSDDQACEIVWLQRTPGGALETVGRSRFTYAQAEKVIGKSGKKLVDGAGWKNYREDMLFARALTRGARRFCPDVFGGAVYALGEEVTDADERPSYEEHVAKFHTPSLPRPVGDLAETSSGLEVRGQEPTEEASEGTAPDDAGSVLVPGGDESASQLDLDGAA